MPAKRKVSTRGGKRPGSGRKPLPAGEKKERVVLYLTPAQAARLKEQLPQVLAAV